MKYVKQRKTKYDFDQKKPEKREFAEEDFLDNLVCIYFREFHDAPLLSRLPREVELDLYRRAKKDFIAKEQFIKSYLRLVVSIAKNYVGRGLSLLDLIQEGNIGLLKALGNFKPEENCRFSTYSTWWIHQSIKRGIVDKSRTVRIPSYLSSPIFRAKREFDEAENRIGRRLSLDEKIEFLVNEHGEDKASCIIAALKQITLNKIETDYQKEEKRKREIPDKKSRKIIDAPELARIDIEELLSRLKPEAAEILSMRYGLNGYKPMTFDEIGERMSPKVTREAVRQKTNKAIKFLHEIFSKN